MTWEEAGLISKYPQVASTLRLWASFALPGTELKEIKTFLENMLDAREAAYDKIKIANSFTK